MAGQNSAVIGGGVAGLGGAWLIRDYHEASLFEENGYAGGHAHALDVPAEMDSLPVDTGLVVFNERTDSFLNPFGERGQIAADTRVA